MENKLAELLKEVMEYDEISKENYANFTYDRNKQITVTIANKSTYKILSSETISIDENNIESINDLIEKIKKLKSREDK